MWVGNALVQVYCTVLYHASFVLLLLQLAVLCIHCRESVVLRYSTLEHTMPASAAFAAQALAAYAAALAADAACVPALLGCAAIYKDSGLLPEALASLEKALLALHISAAIAESGSRDGSASPAADAAAAADSSLAAAGMPCDAASVRQAMAVVLTDLGAVPFGQRALGLSI